MSLPAPGAAGAAVALTRTAFWFLRHGETDWNAQGLSQGRTDIPLNPVGEMQARRAAATMRASGLATIVASPLARARRTAELVAAPLGLPVLLDPDLAEVDFGEQEGLPMGEWYDAWIAGDYTPRGGEAFAALLARAVRGVNAALARPGPVMVVAHGALFRALRLALGHAPNVRTPNALPLHLTPPADGGDAWGIAPAVLAEG